MNDENKTTNEKSDSIWENYVPILKESNSNITNIYLTGSIAIPAVYNETIHRLHAAVTGDTIYLHINSGGGFIDSTFMIISAIKNSKAIVIAKLYGTVASSATVIALACHHIEVSDYTSFMIHNYSGGVGGKGHEMKAQMTFTNTELGIAFRSIYAGFLTETEMTDVIDGKDMWMNKDEVLKRWNDKLNYKGIEL